MVKIISLFVGMLLLVGCCNRPHFPEVKIVEVKVPVLECPASYNEAPVPARPALISSLLTKTDAANPGRVVQACAVDSRQLLFYAEQLEAKVQMVDNMCSK